MEVFAAIMSESFLFHFRASDGGILSTAIQESTDRTLSSLVSVAVGENGYSCGQNPASPLLEFLRKSFRRYLSRCQERCHAPLLSSQTSETPAPDLKC